MRSPPPAPAAPIALASAGSLGLGALDPPEMAAAGLPAKDEEAAGTKPSAVAQRLSAQSAARSVLAMALLDFAKEKGWTTAANLEAATYDVGCPGYPLTWKSIFDRRPQAVFPPFVLARDSVGHRIEPGVYGGMLFATAEI